MGTSGVSLGFTQGSLGERFDIALNASENDKELQEDTYKDLLGSAKKGGGCGYALLQSEGYLRCEAAFRFQFEKKHQDSNVLQNVNDSNGDLLFGLAIVTAVKSDLDYPPFAATGILNDDGQVLKIEGLRAKINAALDIPALCKKGLLFYPLENDGEIDDELRHRADRAQLCLVPVNRLDEAVERLGIPIQGVWLANPYRRLEVFEYKDKLLRDSRPIRINNLGGKWSLTREDTPSDPESQILQFKCREELIPHLQGREINVRIGTETFGLGPVNQNGVAVIEIPRGIDMTQAIDVHIQERTESAEG